jgi:hypothetical protein
VRPEGRALGADWRMLTVAGGDSGSQPWQLVALIRPAWRVEYRDHLNGLPRTARVTSVARDEAASFDVTLALSQLETNVTLGADVFRVDIPPTAQPITLDELRHARPGVREN